MIPMIWALTTIPAIIALTAAIHWLARRITALEQQTPISYDMPPHYDIDMDPPPPIANTPDPPRGPWADEEERAAGIGVYL